ncbi:H-NS family nucleoid-associated regulatory protein [Cupriavidus metallidurans]
MARHGVTPEQLVAAGCFAVPMRPTPAAVRYRSADGQSWDGEGAMPDWLRRAVNAGQTVEHFRVGACARRPPNRGHTQNQ